MSLMLSILIPEGCNRIAAPSLSSGYVILSRKLLKRVKKRGKTWLNLSFWLDAFMKIARNLLFLTGHHFPFLHITNFISIYYEYKERLVISTETMSLLLSQERVYTYAVFILDTYIQLPISIHLSIKGLSFFLTVLHRLICSRVKRLDYSLHA